MSYTGQAESHSNQSSKARRASMSITSYKAAGRQDPERAKGNRRNTLKNKKNTVGPYLYPEARTAAGFFTVA